MTTPRVHNETSVLELDRHGDAHDVVTTTVFPWDMRDNFLIAYLGSGVALEIFNAVDLKLDILLGPQDKFEFQTLRTGG